METLPPSREYLLLIETQFIKQIRLDCCNPVNLRVDLVDHGIL